MRDFTVSLPEDTGGGAETVGLVKITVFVLMFIVSEDSCPVVG